MVLIFQFYVSGLTETYFWYNTSLVANVNSQMLESLSMVKTHIRKYDNNDL